MKSLNTIVKILAALAAIAGAVYIVATYGEQIVAWAKKLWNRLPQCPACEKVTKPAEASDAPAAEEVSAEEAPVEEVPTEEPAPEVIVADHEPVAEEADFAE